MHGVRQGKCDTGKRDRERAAALRRHRPPAAAEAHSVGFTHFPSPRSPTGPHSHFFPSSGPSHPQPPVPDAERRRTPPKDLTSPAGKRASNHCHQSLLKTSSGVNCAPGHAPGGKPLEEGLPFAVHPVTESPWGLTEAMVASGRLLLVQQVLYPTCDFHFHFPLVLF